MQFGLPSASSNPQPWQFDESALPALGIPDTAVNPLRMAIAKCLVERIPLFIHENRLCFYKNGLKQMEILPGSLLEELIQTLARRFPLDYLSASIFSSKDLLTHTKRQIASFEKLVTKE